MNSKKEQRKQNKKRKFVAFYNVSKSNEASKIIVDLEKVVSPGFIFYCKISGGHEIQKNERRTRRKEKQKRYDFNGTRGVR